MRNRSFDIVDFLYLISYFTVIFIVVSTKAITGKPIKFQLSKTIKIATMEIVLIKAGPMYVSYFSETEIRLNSNKENAMHFTVFDNVVNAIDALKEMEYKVGVEKVNPEIN